jgi:hypothetical protein
VEFYGVPIYACVAGIVVCGLLVAGLIASFRVEPPQATSDPAADPLISGPPSHAIVPPLQKPPVGSGTAADSSEPGTDGTLGQTPVRATLTEPAKQDPAKQ